MVAPVCACCVCCGCCGWATAMEGRLSLRLKPALRVHARASQSSLSNKSSACWSPIPYVLRLLQANGEWWACVCLLVHRVVSSAATFQGWSSKKFVRTLDLAFMSRHRTTLGEGKVRCVFFASQWLCRTDVVTCWSDGLAAARCVAASTTRRRVAFLDANAPRPRRS